MNIINNEIVSLPRLTKSNVNFSKLDVDESCGDMSLTFPLIADDLQFDDLLELLDNKIKQDYYNHWYELEFEFEQSFNRHVDLVITMTDYGNYEFNLFKYTDDIFAKIQVELCDDEIKLFEPYMYKYFEPSYQLEQIRGDVEKSVNNKIPVNKLVGLKLVSDRIVNNSYKAAWISENKQKCMICELADYIDNKCPVIITKFGF